MTNTVFPRFQTQYILDFSSASRSLGNTGICQKQSKDVASGEEVHMLKQSKINCFPKEKL
jgi:hypothetical protein